jgi:DNA-binding transcriptional MerR regulator
MPTTQGRTPALTIEELARRVGLSTRNVRAYRTAGLLPPPTLEGRTGRYGDEHLRRLVVIGRLQRRGWSLAAIRDALAAQGAGRSLAELLGLSAEPGRDWVDELFDDQHPAAGPDALLPHGMWN